MKEISLNGQKRTDIGKKASKMLRKEGMVPCNLYGEKKDENGLPEAMAFTASVAELRKAVYTPHVYVINLNIPLPMLCCTQTSLKSMRLSLSP